MNSDENAIDWSRKNSYWENVCIAANTVESNRQARSAMKAYVEGKLGVILTDGEQRSINRVPGQKGTQS